jgi:hypothetical protein
MVLRLNALYALFCFAEFVLPKLLLAAKLNRDAAAPRVDF